MEIPFAPHQIQALEDMKDGCILKGGVGSGKSRVAMGYYFERECGGSFRSGGFDSFTSPRDIYVLTTARKRNDRDWEAEAALFGISTVPTKSFGGVKLTVDSWNNIGKYEEVENAFFVFDEQRLVGSGAWVKAFYRIASRNRWVMLSATPGDNWMDYIPVFVANGYYRNRTDFIHRHVVFKRFTKFPMVDHYVEAGLLLRLRSRLVVDMPYERHTRRHVRNITVDHDKAKLERVTKHRWHVYDERPLKNAGEMGMVARKVINSDLSRLGTTMQLMEQHPKLIVFYNFNYELDALRTMAATLDYPVAEWNGQKHQEIPDTTKWIYLVQYQAGNEAWECIETDAMLFYSMTYSYKVFEQAQGRIDRMNTPYTDLYYYVLRSASRTDDAIRQSLATKRNFNERKFYGDWEE